MNPVQLIISALLLLSGILVILLSVIGVFRFRFIMNRMHCAALIDTLGLFLILSGLMVLSGSVSYIPKLLLILIIQWIGSPIASHMVGRLEVRTDEGLASHMQFVAEDTEEKEEEENDGSH